MATALSSPTSLSSAISPCPMLLQQVDDGSNITVSSLLTEMDTSKLGSTSTISSSDHGVTRDGDTVVQCVTSGQHMLADGEVAKKRHGRRGGRKKKKHVTAKESNKEWCSDMAAAADDDEVIPCLKPRGVSKHTAPDKLARELSRCLSEV